MPRKIGRIVWAWWGGDENDLTTSGNGGGWHINSCTNPTNLTWLGQQVWQDTHRTETLDSVPPSSTSTSGGNGLKGEYYNAKASRVDPSINFNWGTGAPHPSVAADNFYIRWTGQVQPRYSETYTFYTLSDDGVRLWVNGQQLVNNWTVHAPTENKGTIALTAGRKYDIKMEFYDLQQGAVAKLLWSSS
ncbi:MAG TPA: PA14 domain-containing protein, partial [Candidatus Caenarcaniphilales bacterium]